MTTRMEMLERSLANKIEKLGRMSAEHIEDARNANGQPLNDKRNGQATLNKWERQNESIRTMQKSIEATKRAIEIEEGKIENVKNANTYIPIEIQKLVETGELIQWRKHPHIFFVAGVDKARIVWDEKRKVVAHKFVSEITIQEQRTKFVRIYNPLNALLNGR